MKALATIKYQICDRCGNTIDFDSGILARIKRPKVILVDLILRREIRQSTMELCSECSDSLNKFLNGN